MCVKMCINMRVIMLDSGVFICCKKKSNQFDLFDSAVSFVKTLFQGKTKWGVIYFNFTHQKLNRFDLFSIQKKINPVCFDLLSIKCQVQISYMDWSRFIFFNWIFFNMDQSRFKFFNWIFSIWTIPDSNFSNGFFSIWTSPDLKF